MDIPGGIIKFSIHRILLIVMFLFWRSNSNKQNINHKAPFRPYILIYVGICLVSIGVSIDAAFSLKQFLSFTLESVIYYFIVFQSIDSQEDVTRILMYVLGGLAIVGLFAFIEKYSGFNPVDSFVPGYKRLDKYYRDVLSTYPHRILLGTAMSIGFPIALSMLAKSAENKENKYYLWGYILLFAASCYFANSRGPYLGMILGTAIVLLLGAPKIKKHMAIVCCLIALTFIIRPGVLESITIKINDSLDSESVKGQTYQYRFELWKIAYEEIGKSSVRMAFGYGPGSAEIIKIPWVTSYSGDFENIWSWDNHYAADLLEVGMLGLGSVVVLYIAIIVKFLNTWKCASKSRKNIISAIISGLAIIMFMKMNVKLFAPQLNFLFWTLVAGGASLSKIPDTSDRRIET